MTALYYYWTLLNAAASLLVAALGFWKNRHQSIGTLFGVAMTFVAAWLVGFAQYFRPMNEQSALRWAFFTLTAAIANHPFILHCFCALVGEARRWRWIIATAYASTLFFLALLYSGHVVTGLRASPFMDHYVRYNRGWYPYLCAHLIVWEIIGTAILAHAAWKAPTYRRAHLLYFISAWMTCFLTTNLLIVPLEYDINLHPFGFFLLPLNLLLLGYVVSKSRLPDIPLIISRALLYSVALLLVALFSFVFVGGTLLIQPDFMNTQQMYFTVLLIAAVGCTFVFTLPRFLPVVERVVQERFLGHRLAYQEAMAGLVKELARPATLDQMLETVATGVYSHMQVQRVLIFLLDLIGNDYRLRAQAGPNPKPAADGLSLPASSAVVRWLTEKKDALVRDEVMRAAPPSLWQQLAGEFDRFGVSLFVPMVLDDRVVGVIAIGEKLSRDMFYISDLRVLTALATELALATRYRLLEEQAIRDNRLIELGTIAAGIAHEIRNSLASVRTLAQMLPGKSTDPELCELGKRAISDVDRINRVIQNILSFARPGTVNIANHRAAELVDEALMLVQSRLKSKQIRASKKVHDSLVLRVDKPQIVQVLVNILNNAIDAVPLEGEIRIATGEHRLEPAKGQPPRRYGVIEISDNGPGVPAEIRHRIFDLFFTTKKNGTGLGLAISQKIVRDHNGLITVSSLEGQGATFQLHLPAA